MKKFILLLFLLIGCILGYMYYKDMSSKKVNNVVDKTIENKVIDSKYENDLYYNKYLDATKILDKMSLEEKIGQLFLVRYDNSITENYINNYHAGGFILFAKDFQYHTKETISEEINSIQ